MLLPTMPGPPPESPATPGPLPVWRPQIPNQASVEPVIPNTPTRPTPTTPVPLFDPRPCTPAPSGEFDSPCIAGTVPELARFTTLKKDSVLDPDQEFETSTLLASSVPVVTLSNSTTPPAARVAWALRRKSPAAAVPIAAEPAVLRRRLRL